MARSGVGVLSGVLAGLFKVFLAHVCAEGVVQDWS